MQIQQQWLWLISLHEGLHDVFHDLYLQVLFVSDIQNAMLLLLLVLAADLFTNTTQLTLFCFMGVTHNMHTAAADAASCLQIANTPHAVCLQGV
jgi:hypothetical protein